MIQKPSLALLLTLVLLLNNASAAYVCPAIYKPVCCKLPGTTYTASSKCVCHSYGGTVLNEGLCPPSNSRMFVAGPVAQPTMENAYQHVSRSSMPPICCQAPDRPYPQNLSIDQCYQRGGYVLYYALCKF